MAPPSRPSPSATSWGLTDTIALAGSLAVNAVLGFLHLGRRSLWIDEAMTVSSAVMPWRDFVTLLFGEQSNMWVYYVLMRFWVRLGWSEWVLRSLSVMFAVAAVGALYVLARRLFGRPVAAAAALLLAVNAFHVRYAQEARSYSLFVLLTILATWWFVSAVERPTRRNVAGYVLTAVLAFYTHLFALQVLVAHAVSLVFLRTREVSWKRIGAAFSAILLLCLPLLYLAFFVDTGRIGWVGPFDAEKLFDFFRDLTDWDDSTLLKAYGLAVLLVLVRTAWIWRRSGRSDELWRHALVLLWFVLPIALTCAYSLLVSPVFVNRYLISTLPASMLIVGLAVGSLRSRPVAVLLTAVLAVLSLRGTLGMYEVEYPDWRGVTAYVLSQARAGDGVVFVPPWQRTTFDFYRYRSDRRGDPPEELRLKGRRIFRVDDFAFDWSNPRRPTPRALPADISQRHPRMWVIVHGRARALAAAGMEGAQQEGIKTRLARAYGRPQEKSFSKIDVLLYGEAPRTIQP